MLGYTGFPGWFGVDEEDSESCLAFWYLLQESLWSADYVSDVDPDELEKKRLTEETEEGKMRIAEEIYTELVTILKRKVTWPPKDVLSQWSKGNYFLYTWCRCHLTPFIHVQIKLTALPSTSCLLSSVI